MNTKTLFLVALVAALLGLGGWLLGGRSRAQAGDTAEGGLLLPTLAERLNDVTRLEVRTAEDSFAVQIADDGWGLESKGGYPVRMEEVRKTLIALSELRKREKKTANPEYYSKLQVEDVDSEGAKSKLVTVYGPSDEVIASVLIGKRRPGGGPPALFARIPGEATSWLVEGDVNLPASGDAWLDKEILPLDRDLVRAIEVQHPDGEVVFVAEKEESDTTLEVWDVPPDRELKYATVASPMGTALQYLNFTDVVPAAEFERPATPPILTRIWTWDGERVTVEIFTKPAGEGETQETYWAIFHADEDPTGPPRLAMAVPPPPADEGAEATAEDAGESTASEDDAAATDGDAVAAADDDAAGEESSEDEAKAAEEKAEAMRERVAEHARRVEGWVYQIAPYAKGNLAKRMEDLTKPIEPPEGIAAPEGEEGAEAAPAAAGASEDAGATEDSGDASAEGASGGPEAAEAGGGSAPAATPEGSDEEPAAQDAPPPSEDPGEAPAEGETGNSPAETPRDAEAPQGAGAGGGRR